MFKFFVSAFAVVMLTNGIHAQTPAGKQLLATDFSAFVPYGPGAASLIQQVPVSDQAFSTALRINTFEKKGSGDYGMNANIKEAMQNGDVLWISFKARKLDSKRESGEAYFELQFDQLVNGKYTWPSHLESSISVGSSWTEISIPFVTKKVAKPEDVRLNIKFDTYAQSFEISPITFINCCSKVAISSLPKSVVKYGGSEPNAPWRKQAAERIEKYRKGNLTIKVMDAK